MLFNCTNIFGVIPMIVSLQYFVTVFTKLLSKVTGSEMFIRSDAVLSICSFSRIGLVHFLASNQAHYSTRESASTYSKTASRRLESISSACNLLT